MKRLAAAAVATLLLLSACSSEPPPSVADDNAQEGQRTADEGTPGEASAGTQKKSTRSEDRDEGDSTSGGSASAYPARGSYTFSQSGYEEFCDNTGNCDKDRLPKRQPTELTYESSSNDSALVVAEQRQSDSRLTRTWTRFTPSGAHITKVYVKFSYSGFTFERTYEPQPPVEALRFPMTSGESWSGRWRSSTSGSYSVKVGGRTQIDVGGRSVSAYRVETTTEFRGDFEGKSRLTAYVDPDTKAIVATDGVLNVTSNFGRYSTVFETKLADGPRY